MNTKINEEVFLKFPVLETSRLILREPSLSDAEDMLSLRSDREVIKYMDTDPHASVSDSERLLQSQIDGFRNKEGISWIISMKGTGEMLGYIGLWRIVWQHVRAEVGYASRKEFWGKGFTKEALNRVVDFGFNELHLHTIEANIHPSNEVSRKLLLSIGFKKEAYFTENYFYNGKFSDSEVYSLLER